MRHSMRRLRNEFSAWLQARGGVLPLLRRSNDDYDRARNDESIVDDWYRNDYHGGKNTAAT
jgi:hypothetical protein